jgi:hypothetical protein
VHLRRGGTLDTTPDAETTTTTDTGTDTAQVEATAGAL